MLKGDYAKWEGDFSQVITQARASRSAPKLGLMVDKASELGPWTAAKGVMNWVEERRVVASPRSSAGNPLMLQLRIAEPNMEWLDPTSESGDNMMVMQPKSILAVLKDNQGVPLAAKTKTSAIETPNGWVYNLCFWFFPGQLLTTPYVECSVRTTYMLQWMGLYDMTRADAEAIRVALSSVTSLYMLAARFGYAPVPRIVAMASVDLGIPRPMVVLAPRRQARRSLWAWLMRRRVGGDGKIPRAEAFSSGVEGGPTDVTYAASFDDEDCWCVPMPTTEQSGCIDMCSSSLAE